MLYRTVNLILNENTHKHGADITQIQENPVFELYRNKGEKDFERKKQME